MSLDGTLCIKEFKVHDILRYNIFFLYCINIHITNLIQRKIKEFVLFLFISIIGLGLNQLLMWMLVEKIKIYYMIAKIMVTVLVMVYNFITRKLFLEKKV